MEKSSEPVAEGAAATLVLAGTRPAGDPLAAYAGVAHKCLIPVAGVPMLVRVVTTLAATPVSGRIAVSIADPELVLDRPELRALADRGRLTVVRSADRPSSSVAAALEILPLPLLVTTADHALLRPEWIERFWRSLPSGADVVAGIADERTVKSVRPETRRTYLRFADGAVSGCNLFALLSPQARRGVAFWRVAEADRKRPLRMIRRLGPLTALRFVLGHLTLADALTRLSHVSGVRCATVDLGLGEAAIDVDKVDDLALAERILQERALRER